MTRRRPRIACLLALGLATTAARADIAAEEELHALNIALLAQIQAVRHLGPAQMAALDRVFLSSPYIGQGNPRVTVHPMTPADCAARIPGGPAAYRNARFERICGAPYMAPLYDPATQTPEQATACIDMFEFPNIPCAYPVVWVSAREAAQICTAVGERLCDAHEWEGACAGSLQPPDYRWDLARAVDAATAVERMRSAHNAAARPGASWSYGPAYQPGTCAADSSKTPGCDGGSFAGCGSNTYPAGSFPDCHSALGVYDLNGNAAEHMNLPLAPDQMASAGSTTLGVTEMKGSWFIFDRYYAHPDWCRWRAPYWHGSRVLDSWSHENYHLGFRCCKTHG